MQAESDKEFIIVFSSHRIEFLKFMEKFMQRCDTIILEEAPSLLFYEMLSDRISIKEYLQEEIFEFPNFSFRFYGMLKNLFKNGKKILQIEPYMERLLKIHEMFADGKTPKDISLTAELYEVYEIEKKATKSLIDFYEASISKSFNEIVEAVKTFAKADAERFRIRDMLRAEAISSFQDSGRVFIEAGAIHQYLRKILLEKLNNRKVLTVFALEDTVKNLTKRRWIFPPGDILTLRYIFEARENEELENLLSARALIYIMIIEKEEMFPTNEQPIPHLSDELRAIELVNKLSFKDCEKLYFEIRFKSRLKALNTVKDYVLKK
uniref:Uncharacterized protein n=1 Tax=Thermodesulfovibrio aggregans TaxID=86166 RepID=A0A7C4AKE5_9BACT